MAQLEADPEFVARREEAEQIRSKKGSQLQLAEKPLIDDLRAAGVNASSVWDLVNRATPYPQALPILLAHLERPYPDRVREGIARALAVPQAKFAWEALKSFYQREPDGSDAKDGLAVALAAVADDERIGDVVALLQDAKHGESRIFLLRALARSNDERARRALRELDRDPELKGEIRALMRSAPQAQ
jgi:hypothetical protein